MTDIIYVCGNCELISDEPFDACEQCGVPDQCYEHQKGHQSYCAAVKHTGCECDCPGYGEFTAQ